MAGAALLAFSALLALTFGVAAALLVRVRDGAGLIVATMVAAAAQLVLVTEVLSIFSAWSSDQSVKCGSGRPWRVAVILGLAI